jgi:hypothetical protein
VSVGTCGGRKESAAKTPLDAHFKKDVQKRSFEVVVRTDKAKTIRDVIMN